MKKTDLSHTQVSLKTDSSQQKLREVKRSEEKRSKEKSEEKSRDRVEPPDGFDLFWNSYGKKKGKSNAIKEWNKIKPNAELVALIAKKAKEQANAITDSNFRKDPERWLKGKHWEDEIAVKPYNDIF
jgi:hypothetical protein